MTEATPGPVREVGANLCDLYAPLVYGGQVDPWTVVQPGAWSGTEWPCPGRSVAATVVRAVCTCPCHTGGLVHELPPARTAVHPTEVRSDPCTPT